MNKEQRALERTYTGRMNTYGFQSTQTPWGETRQEKQPLLGNVKCALSRLNANQATKQDAHYLTNYQAKLFLAPDIVIEPGSEVVITQDKMTYCFIHSGEAFIYPGHQEIMIERLGYV